MISYYQTMFGRFGHHLNHSDFIRLMGDARCSDLFELLPSLNHDFKELISLSRNSCFYDPTFEIVEPRASAMTFNTARKIIVFLCFKVGVSHNNFIVYAFFPIQNTGFKKNSPPTPTRSIILFRLQFRVLLQGNCVHCYLHSLFACYGCVFCITLQIAGSPS